MAPPQIIQIGNGKKKGGSGLFYAVAGLGTAFAVDYWLSTKKMEEELAKEKSEKEISPEKAEKALEAIQEKPEPVFQPINAEEISKFSNVDDFSDGELEHFLGKDELSVSGEEVTMPLEEPKKLETDSDTEPTVEEKIISRAKSVASIQVDDFVTVEEDASFFPEIPVAIWKMILMVFVALLWVTMRPRREAQVIPGLNEKFESEKIESIPMLGPVCEDASKTAIAVSVETCQKRGTFI